MQTWKEIRKKVETAIAYWDCLDAYHEEPRYSENPTPVQKSDASSLLTPGQEEILTMQLYINLFGPELEASHRKVIEQMKKWGDVGVVVKILDLKRSSCDTYYRDAVIALTDKIFARQLEIGDR
jgi:hypothetical protein